MTDNLELVVIVDGTEVSLDLGDTPDFPLAITYQTAEIKANLANDKRLDDRKGTFSKTFDIPATKKNCTALNHIWNVNILNSEVETIKDQLTARLQDSTGTLLEGFIQVDSVIHLRGEVEKFNLIFFGENFSWIDALGKLDINGIGLDSIPFDEAAIEASWTETSDTQDYVFPLVNFGKWINDYVSAAEMYPAIYIRNIIKKSFAVFGYTVVSDFINGTFFKKLILLANKTRSNIPDLEFIGLFEITEPNPADNDNFIYTNHPDDSYTVDNIDFTTETEGIDTYDVLKVTISGETDGNGHGFVAGEEITITGNANYNGTFLIRKILEDTPGNYISHNFLIDASALSDFGHTNAGGTVTRTATAVRTSTQVLSFGIETTDPSNVFANPNYTVSYAHREQIDAVIQTMGGRGTAGSSVELVVQKNGSDEGNVETLEKDKLGRASGDSGYFDSQETSTVPDGYVVIGDVYNVLLRDLSGGGELFSCMIGKSWGFSNGSTFSNSSITEILFAQELQAVNVLELFKDTVVLFNLFEKTDVSHNKVYIEPRDTFYKSTANAVNWSEYLDDGSRNPNGAPVDQTKEDKIEFLRDMAIEQLFRYKEDSKDGYVKEIEKSRPLPILSHLETLTTRFKRGREEISTKKLAPTWYIYDTIISGITGGLLMPRLWKDFADDGTPPRPLIEFAPRILIYKGLSTEQTINGEDPKWRWLSQVNEIVGYPKAFDINWDNPADEILSFEDENGQDGLFTLYWKNYFNLIKNGVLRTCYLKLNNNHIRNLDLQKPVYIDKTYYIINKISDYKPLKDYSTKVELIKIA